MGRRLGAQRLERIGGRLVVVPDIGPQPWPVDAPARRDINENGEAECWLHGVVDC